MSAALLPRLGSDCIEVALQKLDTDSGSLFERAVLKALTALRQTDPARYQRVRAAAKGKASVTELDKLTTPQNDDHAVVLFPDTEPWPHPVDGAAMLTAIYNIIAQHVVADPPTIRAAALWIVHTDLAPEKRIPCRVIQSTQGEQHDEDNTGALYARIQARGGAAGRRWPEPGLGGEDSRIG